MNQYYHDTNKSRMKGNKAFRTTNDAARRAIGNLELLEELQ
jgi:hypothetical protein